MNSSEESWIVASAIAGCVSAVAAAAGLAISAAQTRANSKAIGFASAQAFSTQCRELWKDCRAAAAANDADGFQNALNEIFASFELFSISVNDLDLSDKVRSFIIETILDYLSDMHKNGYAPYLSGICENPHVCKELKRLVVQHHGQFKDPAGIAEMLGIERASVV